MRFARQNIASRPTRFRRAAASIAAVLVFASAASAGDRDERAIALDAAPAAVKAAVVKAMGTSPLEELKRCVVDGRTLFEAEFAVAGVEHELLFTEAGQLVETRIDIALDALPAAVSKAVLAKYPALVIDEAERVEADGKTSYNVSLETADDRDERELRVTADGTITSDRVDD